jgi:trigger factor
MQVNVIKNEKSQVELEITVSTEEIKPFLDKAAKNISKDVKIAGFRPGNVPYDILKQKVGEAAIWQEAGEMIIPNKILEAVYQEKLEIAEQPQVEIIKIAPNNELVFKAKFATIPKIKIGDYKKLKVKPREIKIDEKKIDQTIDDIRKMRSKETLVKRASKIGDKVLVDIEMFNNKVPIEGGQSQGTIIILGDSYFLPGLDEQLIGLKEGEQKEFTLPYPTEYYDKKLAGKKIDFKVKLVSVHQMDLPEINDEFIAGLGNFKTLTDLKAQIKENLESEESQKLEHEIENEVLTKMLECCQFDEIPQSLINRESQRMLAELKQDIEARGLNFDDYLLQLKKSTEEITKSFEEQAKKRIQVSLAIRQIGLDEKIEADDQAIDDEISRIIAMYPDNAEVKQQAENPRYRERLAEIIGNQKTVEHLKNHIIDKPKQKDDSKETKSKDDKKSDN